MIRINVSEQLKENTGSTRIYEASEVADWEGNDECPIQGKIKLVRTDRSIVVNARLKSRAEAVCSRCLSSFNCSLDLRIDEEYFPTIDILTGLPLHPIGDAGSFTIDVHHILDLDETIRQYTLLAMPMKPLCRQDCAGLCPQCGSDLNQGSCGCSRAPVGQRRGKLVSLLQKIELDKKD